MQAREIIWLMRKELRQEIRHRYALSSILLYVVATIFVCYLSFRQLSDPAVWNTLFWIIMLFSALNAVSKSFVQETRGKLLYLYTLASPGAVILAKLFYNTLLMAVVALVTFLFYSLFIGQEPLKGATLSMYLTALLLGCTGFSGIFTLVAAIASKSGNNLGIMAILGFPLVIPLLITLIEFSGIALRGLPWSFALTPMMLLAGINVLVGALSYILFPYLWRE